MKINSLKIKILIGISLMVQFQGYSQGFVNLNFESATGDLTPGPFFQVPITNAMPGWTGYIDGSQVSSVAYNATALDSAAIALLSSAYALQPIQGSYSAFLQSGNLGGSVALAQTGMIGAQFQSLLFSSSSLGIQMTFNGQLIPFIELNQTARYSVFGADISGLAGQTGELRFTAFHTQGFLDAIQFSTQSIPDPSSYSLLGCGVLLFGAARATFKRRQ